MKTIIWIFALAATVRAAIADAETQLEAALKRLDAHQNYSWSTTVTPAYVSTQTVIEAPPADGLDLPTARRDVTRQPVAISGKTDSGRGTLIEGVVSQLGQPVTMKAAIWNDRRVAETPEGWYTQREIEAAAATLESASGATLRWEADNSFAAGSHRLGPSNYIYGARFYMSLHAPLDELRMVLAGGQPTIVKGMIVQTLGNAAATKFWHDLRFRDGSVSTDKPPRSIEGKVSVWLKNGEVTKYEVVVTGDVVSSANDPVYRGREHTVQLVKTTTLSGFDRTEVAIPPKALARLGG
jgi:hypothetical protein